MLAGALGLSSMGGTLATVFASRAATDLSGIMLSVAAGMFIHIAATDLLPTTAQVRGLKVMAVTLTGAGSVIIVSALLKLAL